ncbi:MAG: hypothetical protein JWL82_339 [Parcubacteria group bacterium]|nr:hypothetical protein [Parcubacteria group bacterium]
MLTLNPSEKPGLNKAFNDAVRFVLGELGEKEHAEKGMSWRAFFVNKPFQGCRDLSFVDHNWAGGTSNIAKQAIYGIYSAEKVHRTAMGYYDSACVTSMDSRKPEDEKYGGGIILSCRIKSLGTRPVKVLLAGSGLPEDADESVMLLVPHFAGWDVTRHSLRKVFSESPNALMRACLKRYHEKK